MLAIAAKLNVPDSGVPVGDPVEVTLPAIGVGIALFFSTEFA